MSNILIVDDEPSICWSAREFLSDRGHNVKTVGSVGEAWQALTDFRPHAVVLDVRLPGEDGLSALPQFRQRFPDAPVIVMTAFGDLSTAVAALGRGATDYLVKPFDLREFAEVIEGALATPEGIALPQSEATTSNHLVGRSRAMQSIFRQIALVAPTSLPVLLLGETGTGKEVAAREIHAHGPNPQGPFIAVCLAALNPTLIESELFGHVRGAFTDAVDHRVGLFELANHGTIFLDEIADTPLPVQVKLLRVLETNRFCPLGSGVERETNARLIAATNQNIAQMVAQGKVREDLYHRLKVFSIEMPPLRERNGDLELLVNYFLQRHPEHLRPAAAEDFWKEIHSRRWMGNVRELRNAVDHAVILARGQVLRAMHLPPDEPEFAGDSPAKDQLTDVVSRWVRDEIANLSHAESHGLHARLLELVESALFREILGATQNNRSAAAKLLGIDRATLRSRLKRLFGEEDDTDATETGS